MSKHRSLGTVLSAFILGAVVLVPLTRAAAEGNAGHHQKDGKASIEGTAKKVSGSCPNLRFVIAETRVVTKDATRYEDGSCNDVKDGERVEVKGKLSGDGTLSAWKVELDDKD